MFVATIVLITVGGFTLFELYTGHFRLTRIERKATLLNTILEQRANVSQPDDPRIYEIHNALIDDLQWSIYNPTHKFSVPTWLLKAAAAAAPWFAIGLIIYFVTEKGSFATVFAGILMIAIPVTFIATLIPDFTSNSWVNYWSYPIGAFVLIMTPMFLYGRGQDNTPKTG